MAPVLPFLAEDIWRNMPDSSRKVASVFLTDPLEAKPELLDSELEASWNYILR
jgi:isoleucyl-tRNA synthetase